MTEEQAYQIAFEEMQTQQLHSSVFAKAVAFSEGDEKKAKANYLKFRAEQLIRDEKNFVYSRFRKSIINFLFSPKGRIGQSAYIGILFLAFLISFITNALANSATHNYYGYREDPSLTAIFLSLPFYLASISAFICAHLKRCRDAGMSPYLVFLYIIWPVGICVTLILAALPTVQSSPSQKS